MVLFDSNFKYKEERLKTDINGNYIILGKDIEGEKKSVQLISIYRTIITESFIKK